MAPYESRRNIFVQPVDGKQAVRITSETERDLAGYFWAGDNRILYLRTRAATRTTSFTA